MRSVIRCPHCGIVYRVDAEVADRPFNCSRCKQPVNQPQSPAPAAVAQQAFAPQKLGPPKLPAHAARSGGWLSLRLGDVSIPAWAWIGVPALLLFVVVLGIAVPLSVSLSRLELPEMPEPPAFPRSNAPEMEIPPQNVIGRDVPLAEEPLVPVPAAMPRAPRGAALTAEQIFSRCNPAIVQINVSDRLRVREWQGSGFFVDARGLMVTNYHVVEGGYYFQISENDTHFSAVNVVAFDRHADLAIVRVPGRQGATLTLAGDALPPIGAKVFAIGSPKGLTNTLTEGLVSAHRDVSPRLRMIQTSAAISGGSSGGPLINEQGEVVGVNTLKLVDVDLAGFAVPVEQVHRLLRGAR